MWVCMGNASNSKPITLWSSTAKPIATFWYTPKMSIISKTVRDRAISSKCWTHWPVLTLDIMSQENFFYFPNFGHHLKFWGKLKMLNILQTIRDRAISIKFWIIWAVLTLEIMSLKIFFIFQISSHHLEFWPKSKMSII